MQVQTKAKIANLGTLLLLTGLGGCVLILCGSVLGVITGYGKFLDLFQSPLTILAGIFITMALLGGLLTTIDLKSIRTDDDFLRKYERKTKSPETSSHTPHSREWSSFDNFLMDKQIKQLAKILQQETK